ncbi:hypothetical protein [Ramlibacter alkalitolerans]|uniref:Outer membrane protein beta-barrel domain-containing protein n=1 Tax=Ramlibacter alkalitolerans TaxID=2039631 RepID=A0ABS1JSE7_9BURK|nr:hypothetical protein [Ramlibacter alkalitolerans]MBL0427163.1 hypothetical protein [Ramlibacter alkalitolerans]
MTRARASRTAALLIAASAVSCSTWAAGGHHGVDDATILPQGECEQETWFTRQVGGDRLLHAGFNCRVGPVELGIAAEHPRAVADSGTGWNAEAKWAAEVAAGVSVGIDLQPVWQPGQRPRFVGTRAVAIATWVARPELALHLNVGRDFLRSATNVPRHGVGADWTPLERWTFTAERYLQDRTQQLRAGVRWEAGRLWKVDFSRAQRLHGPAPSNWTIGLTLDFGEE